MERDVFTEALHKSQSSAPNIASQFGFDETAEVLEKGRRASIGEIRDWKGQKMWKTTDGWKPVKVQTKFDLEKVEVQSVKDGSVTESELDAMPNGTEIYYDGMRFQKVDGLGRGWFASFEKDPRDYQSQTTSHHIVRAIARMSYAGTWEKKFDKVLMPKKESSSEGGFSLSAIKDMLVNQKSLGFMGFNQHDGVELMVTWRQGPEDYLVKHNGQNKTFKTAEEAAKYVHKHQNEKPTAKISDIKVGDSIIIQGFGPCSVIKAGSEGLSLKRDADGVEFTLSKEWVEKLGLKSAKGGEGKSTDGLKNVKNLAKDFLTTADKLEVNVSRYLNGSNDKEDVEAYDKVRSLEKKFLEAYNKHFDERVTPALNYDIAESVLDEE